MKKWKCKNCGKEKKINHENKHKIAERPDTAECLDCGEIFHSPTCCDKKMYVAS